MSSCLVLQAKDKLYIGADTSSSVFIDDKLYRLNNNTKKLFLLNDNTVLYCAGNNSIAEKVVQHISSIYCRNDFSLISLKNWLIEMYPYENKDKTVYDVEILIATFKNNRTIVYQMSQYKNYDIVSFEVSDAGVQILSAGIKNAECMSFAENELLNKSDVKSIFRTTFNNLSCNYIGGCLDLYEITKNGAVKIFDNEKINEHGIQYVHDVFNGLSVSLNAEVLVSKLVMSENLWIENNSGTYKFDDAGFIASSGKNSVRIQPNKSGELFSIYKGNNRQVYINSDGDVQFSGLVSGGSININNKFMVDKDGNVTAKSGSFSCDITGSSGTFGGVTINSNGLSSNQFSIDAYGNASFSGTLSAASITSSGVLNGYLTSSDLANAGSTTINGANITTGTINCDLLDGGTINGQEFRQVSDYGELLISNGIIRVPRAGAILIGNNEAATQLWVQESAVAHAARNAYDSDYADYAISAGSATNATYLKNGSYVYISSNGNLIPSSSDVACGTSANPFKTGHSVNGWKTTSDERVKKDFVSLDDDPRFEAFFYLLNPTEYKLKSDKDGIVRVGFGAQTVKAAMDAAGIAESEFHGFSHEYVDMSQFETEEERQQFLERNCGNADTYSLSYQEFIALNTHMIQKQHQEIESLKKEFTSLEQKVNQLIN